MRYYLILRKYLLVILFVILILLPLTILAAQTKKKDIYGLEEAATEAGYETTPQAPEVIIGKIMSYVLAFVGVVFLILMIYAGFLWMTAGGNEEKIKRARNILFRSVIGLVIILGAAMITGYILIKLTPTFLKPS